MSMKVRSLILFFICVNIGQYICDIKKNKLKPENIMKFSIIVRRTGEISKSLRIGTNGLEIEVKDKNYTIADTKNIIFFLQAFHVYTRRSLLFWQLRIISYNFN